MEDGGYTRPGGGEIGAHSGPYLGSQARDLALSGGCHLDVLDVVTAVGGGLVVLAAGLGPLHRPAHLHGTEGYDGFIGVECDLAAEAAPHLGSYHPELVLGHSSHHGAEKAGDMGILGGVPQGELSAGAGPLGYSRAGLNCVRYEPLLDYAFTHHYLGGAEGSVRVAPSDHPVEGLIVGGLLVQLGRPRLQSLLGVYYHGQGS